MSDTFCDTDCTVCEAGIFPWEPLQGVHDDFFQKPTGSMATSVSVLDVGLKSEMLARLLDCQFNSKEANDAKASK